MIELIGSGIKGESNPNLPLSDLYNIDSVITEAIYKADTPPLKNGVMFYYKDEAKASSYKTISDKSTIGKFFRTFKTSDINGVFADVTIDNVYSFYEFIYRDIPTSMFKSYSNLETAYMYHNGSKKPVVYEIPINTASASRDINIIIPITELNKDARVAIIDISIGLVKKQFEIKTYNSGISFYLGKFSFPEVPGNIKEVTVSIYSPNPKDGEVNGDSFIVSGVIVNVDKVFDGCTLTQGYWKNHSDCPRNGNGPRRDATWDLIGEDGEFTPFFESDQNYCQVFKTNPGKGGKYYILAHQYMAAELNLLNNANPSSISDTFNKATAFLMKYSPSDVDGNKNLENKCVTLGGILDKYNNGLIGPGHCDDNNSASNLLSIDEQIALNESIKIYPNPVSVNGSINFVPKHNAKTIIEVYNVLGQRVSVLYDKYTMGGVPLTVDYDAQRFKQGIHFVQFKNGSSTVTKKISIRK